MGCCRLSRSLPDHQVVNEMNYGNSLKALRAKMLEKTTGMSEPVVGLESFIPARQAPQPEQPTTEDLMSKGASWLSEIKKAAVELRQTYEKEQALRPQESGAEKVAKSVSNVINESEAAERREAFIARRAESSPSTYAPDRPAPRRTITGLEAPTPGYGEISQKQMENIIRSEAQARGIDPDVATAIFYSEGAGAYQSQIARSGKGSAGGKEASYGPFQLYTGGGLGNKYEQATGRDLRADNTMDGVTNQIRFALDAAVESGWSPWYGRKTAGVGVRDGLGNAKKIGNWS